MDDDLKNNKDRENEDRMRIFTGNANPALAQKIAECLKKQLGQILVSRFSDGEIRGTGWRERTGTGRIHCAANLRSGQ
jgi:hypothetical protein